MVLDELKQEESSVEINGVTVLIAEHVRPYTDSHKIDYISNPHGQGFAIVPVYGSSCC